MADVCSWSGDTQGIVNGICPGRQDDWQWITEMVMYPPLPGESTLESCPISDDAYLADLPNPGWRLRVDATLPGIPPEHTTDHYYTQVVATRLDGPAPCAVKLVWILKQQSVNLPVGTIVRYSHQYTILNVEKDVFEASVLRDDKGALLIGFARAIRPEVWYTDMWPEMTLSFGSTPVCRKPQYPDALALRLTLSSGADTCTLDSGTAKCCSFSGVPYEVVCPDAWRSASGDHPDYAYVLVARQDILVPAP
jgi:hypothetical protein